MDKPRNLSVKDFLIRKMSVKEMKPEYVLDAIVSHQFSSAREALYVHKSVELSGLGKFLFNQGRANRKFEKYLSQERVFSEMVNNESLSSQKRASAEIKLKNVLKCIEELKPKIDVYTGDD